MTITLNQLPESVERYIAMEVAAGKFNSAEEMIASLLAEKSRQAGIFPDDGSPRKSTEGILAHEKIDMSEEELRAFRHDLWKNFPREME